jgi:hypothetical protein
MRADTDQLGNWLLAPDIVEAIVGGWQPNGLTSEELTDAIQSE